MSGVLQGQNKLEAQLDALASADFVPALVTGVEQEILPEMQSLTPVDTGALVESEHVEVENNAVLLVAGGGDLPVDYAGYVEFGTVHMDAQPYMRPAIDTKSGAAMVRTAKEVDNIMRRTVNG